MVSLQPALKSFSDHKEGFKGLSNLKELALSIGFDYEKSDRRSWWGLPLESKVRWYGGSRKSEAVFNLLQVTKELQSFEISQTSTEDRLEDESELYPGCVFGLDGRVGRCFIYE